MSDRSFIDQQDVITAGILQEAAVEQLQRARVLNLPMRSTSRASFKMGSVVCPVGRDIAEGVTGWATLRPRRCGRSMWRGPQGSDI